MQYASDATNDALGNLIVNYLPPEYKEEDVRTLFSRHGEVERVKLIVNPESGLSKCYAFVLFRSAEDAAKAIRSLCGYEINGKALRVAYAQATEIPGGLSPTINLFFSGFGSSMKQEDIVNLAKKFGEVKECNILDMAAHPRGVAFVRFASVSQAEMCARSLNNQEISKPDGSFTLVVKFAERKQQKPSIQRTPMRPPAYGYGGMPHQGGGMRGVVFVHGISGETEQDVRSAVYPLFGNSAISKIDIPKGDKGEPKNFCFLHYYNPVDAHRAIGLNGITYKGKQLQVRMR